MNTSTGHLLVKVVTKLLDRWVVYSPRMLWTKVDWGPGRARVKTFIRLLPVTCPTEYL